MFLLLDQACLHEGNLLPNFHNQAMRQISAGIMQA